MRNFDSTQHISEAVDNGTTQAFRIETISQGRSVARADVRTAVRPGGTVHVSFCAIGGHLPPGTRTSLVDAVLDSPAVRGSDRLQATVPIGDAESILRLRERTIRLSVHPAGSTVIIDAAL